MNPSSPAPGDERPGAEPIHWHGERLLLDPDRALVWPAARTLFLADLHLGKPAAYRRLGTPVSEAVTDRDLLRLDALIARHHPERLVVLGDLFHSRAAWDPEVIERVSAWRAAHATLELLLVSGNHDARAGPPPHSLPITLRQGPCSDGPWRLMHDPAQAASESAPVLCGHLHPGVRLVSPLGSMRAPCFWFGTRVGVLPAFGRFTGCALIRPREGDRVFALGHGRVMEVRGRARITPASERPPRPKPHP